MRRLMALVLLAGMLAGGCSQPYSFRGGVLEPPAPAPDFTLQDHNGLPFRLSDQRGQVILLFFGFTSCPDICPTTMAELAAVRRELATQAGRVQTVFVTVDPERDTATRVRQYLALFDPQARGLVGSPDEIAAVMTLYGVTAIRQELPGSALGYTIDHTATVYLIDPDGRLRVQFPYGMPVPDMISDIRFILNEGA